jgi:type I restriction enzyme S subunit
MPRRETQTGGRDATNAIVSGRYALSIGRPPVEPPHGFTWRKLTDVGRLESGHTPSRTRPDYWDGNIPWIGIKDATENHGLTINETNQYISQSGLDNSSARLLPAGTVCLSRTASVGYVVTMGVPMATSQDFVNWVCGPDLSPKYLSYVLMAEQDSVRRFAYGTTHQTMYYPDAKALHACLPTRPAQDAVVDVLGALDDKIAANTKLASVVDDYLETLLLAKLSSSEHEVTTLREIADVNSSTVKPVDGGLRYVDITSVGVGRFELPTMTPWSDAPSRARRRIRRGDTMWSTVRPNRRSHALNLSDDPALVGSTGIAVISPRTTGFAYLYEVTRLPEFTSFLESVADGSAYPAVRADRFGDAPVPLLSVDRLEEFEKTAAPLRTLIHSAFNESRQLVELRDVLLPALMSGKLRVKDAKKQVAAVV